ncbi:sensor histidine kinase [Streptomyces sp. NPDC089919]|uniref:sensor histidine kinase n=1 Tax=Streptomyces sp. NPDC089919 TaxID=3155188 RepID=UPI003444F51C
MNVKTTRDPADALESDGLVRIGARPVGRRQTVVKSLWVGIWLLYLGAPVSDLVGGGHSVGARALGALGLAGFVAWYLVLVFRTGRPFDARRVLTSLGVMAGLATLLVLSLGREWLVLFVYVSIASGAALPSRYSRWTVPGTSALLALLVPVVPGGADYLAGLLVPALLGGFAMAGVRKLIATTVELRQARATVAELAANEERLRLARDLHDLLGHSLSLITLKSELAGRMLPDHPDRAAQQISDIEQVCRQALVDVREAVSGYRRPTLPGELAGARTALTAAGIAADLPLDPELPELPEEAESALAWALREAVTNVVRHSSARRCTVELVSRNTLDGPELELVVRDDGSAGGAVQAGNGLTGLTERLAAVGGRLSAAGTAKGFTLRARVPLEAPSPDA